MSKPLYHERLSGFKDGVIQRLVYKNAIRFFLLFLFEGMILYGLGQILAPITIFYNHVWLVGLLACVVGFAFIYLNVSLINDLVTAQGKTKFDFRYNSDRYFVQYITWFLSFVFVGVAFSAVNYLAECILAVVVFVEVMGILITAILMTGAIIALMTVVMDWMISIRRDETWWCDEMDELFKEKTADNAIKELIKENKGVIKGQYDR